MAEGSRSWRPAGYGDHELRSGGTSGHSPHPLSLSLESARVDVGAYGTVSALGHAAPSERSRHARPPAGKGQRNNTGPSALPDQGQLILSCGSTFRLQPEPLPPPSQPPCIPHQG